MRQAKCYATKIRPKAGIFGRFFTPREMLTEVADDVISGVAVATPATLIQQHPLESQNTPARLRTRPVLVVLGIFLQHPGSNDLSC